eukprot:1179134-Prorocentrum_minimum.AAC.5
MAKDTNHRDMPFGSRGRNTGHTGESDGGGLGKRWPKWKCKNKSSKRSFTCDVAAILLRAPLRF